MAVNKKFGKHSQGANDNLMPWTPTIGTATDVGTNMAYNAGSATVTFTANGPYAATSYTVLASTGQSATGASSPITVTGLATGATPTFTVKATNSYGDSAYSSASNQITVTTVPATPATPTATSPSAGTDTVSWSAPATGGKAITNYYWESNDSKSGNAGTATSVNVAQEQGTQQAYRVYATNGNGNSQWSAYSNTVTTTFTFVPFSVFGFSPFGFSPFGFSPFGFSPFSFSPFGFSPFGVFGFSPFSVFGFSPFGVFSFAPSGGYFKGSLSPSTKVVMADGSLKESVDVQVGDELMSAILPGLNPDFSVGDIVEWSSIDLSNLEKTTTTVKSIETYTSTTYININGDSFSKGHLLLTNRNNEIKMRFAQDIVETDLIWGTDSNNWEPIVSLEKIEYDNSVVSINCQPYDIFFTEKALTHDSFNG